MLGTELVYFSVDPGRSPCLACWKKTTYDVETSTPGVEAVGIRLSESLPRSNPGIGPVAAFLGSLVAFEALRCLTRYEPPYSAGAKTYVEVAGGCQQRASPGPRTRTARFAGAHASGSRSARQGHERRPAARRSRGAGAAAAAQAGRRGRTGRAGRGGGAAGAAADRAGAAAPLAQGSAAAAARAPPVHTGRLVLLRRGVRVLRGLLRAPAGPVAPGGRRLRPRRQPAQRDRRSAAVVPAGRGARDVALAGSAVARPRRPLRGRPAPGLPGLRDRPVASLYRAAAAALRASARRAGGRLGEPGGAAGGRGPGPRHPARAAGGPGPAAAHAGLPPGHEHAVAVRGSGSPWPGPPCSTCRCGVTLGV